MSRKVKLRKALQKYSRLRKENDDLRQLKPTRIMEQTIADRTLDSTTRIQKAPDLDQLDRLEE